MIERNRWLTTENTERTENSENHFFVRSLCALCSLWFICCSVHAATPEQIEFFEKRIRPILAQECYECHSAAGKKKGGLLLDSRPGWQEGGKSGQAILPGNAKESPLIIAIRHEGDEAKMPKNGAKLDDNVIRDFEQWVNMGAPDPRDAPPSPEEITRDTDWNAVLQRRKTRWCFQPVQNPPPPAVKDAAWPKNPVDQFLLAKMESENLRPAADADARVFFRRLSFVLTGLPPTPDDTDAFAKSAAENIQSAVEAAADKMLASPRFGERWARHWMDWMRYADSHGSEGDPQIPFAWRYRDYLIRALNADIPYPQLVREHIAGDLLETPRPNKEMGINESALGAAHYRMVLHGFTPTDAHDEEVTFTDNQIDTVSKAFLGITVSCARCHNHKFDAISQADFYALFGIFASCRPATIDVNLPERQKLNVDRLSDLKGKIRNSVSGAWLKSVDEAVAKLKTFQPDKKQPVPGALTAWTRLSALPPEKWDAEWKKLRDEWQNYSSQLQAFRAQDTFQRWDLRGEDLKKWGADGAGLLRGSTPAGEFHINHDGERVIANVFPSGVYSHLLSDKHRGLLGSPIFPSEGGKLWIRVRGSKAHARYVVRNYPRSGLIYPKADLNSDADQWLNWDLNYWKGDTLHVEIATDQDQPIEIGNSDRSYFGVTEVLYVKNSGGIAPPAPTVSLMALCAADQSVPKTPDELAALYSAALRRCVEDFHNGKMNDDEAEFLAAFVQKDWLPNSLKTLPDAAPLVADYRKLEAEVPVPTRAPGVMEGFAFDQALFTRGNHKQPAQIVPRRFLDAIDPKPYQPGPARSGRRELAESIVAANNPLTNRVIVNRLWHYVFGEGIVSTPDNFGKLGEAPTHPELLDFLTTKFEADGSSMKKTIRLLVTSRAFRLDHAAPNDAATRDPQNKWLTHYSSRRLDAEAIRDSLLSLTGKLDLAVGGGPVDGGANRRSVYLRVTRNNLDPFMTAFDFPVPSGPRGKRDATNVPAQALAMLNAPLVNRWAAEWARRVLAESKSGSDDDRLRRMFSEAFARTPTDAEVKESLAFVKSAGDGLPSANSTLAEFELMANELRAKVSAIPEKKDTPQPELAALKADLAKADEQVKEQREQLKAMSSPDFGWICLAQALINAKEFIYVR